MQQWEYYVLVTKGEWKDELDKLGAEGWELVTSISNFASLVFKRPKRS